MLTHPLHRHRKCSNRAFSVLLAVGCVFVACHHISAQLGEPISLGDGLKQISSTHLDLVTDLPIDESVRELPIVFDIAVAQWQEFFERESKDIPNFRATAYLIGDRDLFRKLGYFTPDLPPIRDGFQAGNRLFVMEQESTYYRRHLLLHEGVHWVMFRLLGGCGPPWHMEGAAEYLATHEWDGSNLRQGIIPPNRESVPYWGRIRLIRDDLRSGQAPTLDQILRYSNSQHQQVEPYAWSWAAYLFFFRHPKYQEFFKQLSHNELDYSYSLNGKLESQFKNQWSEIQISWQTFIRELDYGFDFERAVQPINASATKNLANSIATIEIASDTGWQFSGLEVATNDVIDFDATGRIAFANVGKVVLEAESAGVTLEYVNGYPRGALLGMIVPRNISVAPTVFSTNDLPLVSAEPGLLFFRVNDHWDDLSNNAGQFTLSFRTSPTTSVPE